MRSFLLFLVLASAALLVPLRTGAATLKSIELRGRVVDYYSNRFILTADGNVRVQLNDGTVIRGDTFTMDLKLNRFLVAGDVHLDGPNVHEVGAAFAGYPDLERNYFLNAQGTPDRWTYYGLDWSDRHAGRQQPGDAFAFPDLGGAHPYIISRGATVFLKNNVEFPVGSRIDVVGVYLPTPGYVVTFSPNPNFAQNAFSGAVADIGIPYKASADSVSAFHVRYDTFNGAYLSFDQHIVHDRDYLVFSINPLTQDNRQYNLIGYKRESNAVESRIFYQLSTESQGFARPITVSDYGNVQVNARVGRYAVSTSVDQYNDSLLGNAFNGLPNHPSDAQLAVQSFEDEIRPMRYLGVPVKFQYRGGIGFDHDGYGITSVNGAPFGGVNYTTIWQHFIGLTLYTSSLRVAKQTSFSLKGDKQRQWFSLGHYVDTATETATLAHTPNTSKLPAEYLAYTVQTVGDYYGALQTYAYAPFTDVVTTPFGTYSGLAAFRGLASTRYYTGSLVYAPTPYFTANFIVQRFYTNPAPVPGLGGLPPWQFSGDVRLRLSAHVLMDIGRSYFFNFADQRWSPQFTIQFSP